MTATPIAAALVRVAFERLQRTIRYDLEDLNFGRITPAEWCGRFKEQSELLRSLRQQADSMDLVVPGLNAPAEEITP